MRTLDNLFGFQDQNVLITGDGRGIGRVLAFTFADAGATAMAVARTQAVIESVAGEVRSRRRQALEIRPTSLLCLDSGARPHAEICELNWVGARS
jgi:NAD(P)-dependent dehydrogenase (short-subunit alcohol dehydrogenase family)